MNRTRGLVAACLLGLLVPQARGARTDGVQFERDIRPILEASCVECHGRKKGKAKLRLHTPEQIARGSESGPVLVPGQPEQSTLFQRITLPVDDLDRMPEDGDPLPAGQIELIRRWIEEGAEFGASDSRQGEPDPALEALAATGAVVLPVKQGASLLSVSFRGVARFTGDAQIEPLLPLAERIAILDLAGTTVTDAGVAALATFENLERLHLANTEVGDATVQAVGELPRLELLGLHGTRAGDGSIDGLGSAPALKKVFLGNSAVTAAGAARLRRARPDLLVQHGEPVLPEPIAAPLPHPDPINRACPVHRNVADPATYYVYQTQVIAFCDIDCRAKFVAAPREYEAAVENFRSLGIPEETAAAIQATSSDPTREVTHRVLAADASKGVIALLDEEGGIEWRAEVGAIHDLQLLENGNILYQESFTRLVERSLSGELIWSYDAATSNGNQGRPVEVHAFRRLDDEVTMIAESGPARIIEVDREGRLLHSVPLTVDAPHPHRDTRLVRKLQNGHYLVAHEGDGAVREYDAAGRVVWEYDVPLFGRERRPGHGLDAFGNQVFAAIRLPNGNTLVSTGNGHSVLEVDRDGEIVWRIEQDDLPGIRLAWVTTLELLPNGNYLIGNCHAGPDQPQVIEITPDRKVVWTFKDFDTFGDALSNSTLADAHEDARFYRDEVRPILASHCYECHGDLDEGVKGELFLAARNNLVEGGHSGPVIDPVEPEMSRLLRYINHEDAEHRMPPKGDRIPDDAIAILTDWVRRGVPMEVVENERVYQRPGLISAEDRRFWSFQPVGDPRPPQVGDPEWVSNGIDAFVLSGLEQAGLAPNPAADRISLIRRATYDLTGLPPTRDEVEAFLADASDDAYPRLIERLLASPHYGEQWGRHWLDLVRYAETNGYERDSRKPEVWKYRQYVIDAFNADTPYDRFLLEQLAGDELDDADAGSITATGYFRLGLWDDEPADRKQAVFDGLDDVVRTTSELFLGLTMGCARCHDHKIDPIPQSDYYRMLAFFRNVRPYSDNREHILTDIASPEEKRAAERKNDEIARQRAALVEQRLALRERFIDAYRESSGERVLVSDISELRYAFYRDSFEVLPDFSLLKAETIGTVESNFFDLSLATRNDSFGFVFEGKLEVPADGDYTFFLDSDDGSRLLIDGRMVVERDGIHGLGDEQQATVALTRGWHDIRLEYFQGHHGKALSVAWAAKGEPRRMLSKVQSQQEERILTRLLKEHGEQILGPQAFGRLRRLDREIGALKDLPTGRYVLSVKEPSAVAPETFVLIRGSAHAPGELVEPGFPEVLGDVTPEIAAREKSSGRRLALARWLADEHNPLTYRVMVNRIWQYHLGRGIVRSSSDFGQQGERPTHPELLDWLARRFVEGGASIKSLHRLIMLSSTYRMSSAPNPAASAIDPRNDRMWRFDMRRLSAEEIRDSIRALTGRLNLEIGGASVYPDIPEQVLEGQSKVTWPGRGGAANNDRRSVYTHVKRSLLDPFIESFDAATTDNSCPVRFNTTQPTQALTLLNSDFINQAAADLARSLQDEVGADPAEIVRTALLLATGRQPDGVQVERGVAFLADFEDPVSPDQALQQFALIVLNLNEFLFLD